MHTLIFPFYSFHSFTHRSSTVKRHNLLEERNLSAFIHVHLHCKQKISHHWSQESCTVSSLLISARWGGSWYYISVRIVYVPLSSWHKVPLSLAVLSDYTNYDWFYQMSRSRVMEWEIHWQARAHLMLLTSADQIKYYHPQDKIWVTLY